MKIHCLTRNLNIKLFINIPKKIRQNKVKNLMLNYNLLEIILDETLMTLLPFEQAFS